MLVTHKGDTEKVIFILRGKKNIIKSAWQTIQKTNGLQLKPFVLGLKHLWMFSVHLLLTPRYEPPH